MKKLALAVAILWSSLAHAGEIKISLLDEPGALADTLSLLKSNGCAQASITAFSNAFAHYYQTPIDIDLSKFPKPEAEGA